LNKHSSIIYIFVLLFKQRKTEGIFLFFNARLGFRRRLAVPTISPIIITITIQIIMAITDIAHAINQPVSKKCFTKASQMNSIMIEAMMPEKKYGLPIKIFHLRKIVSSFTAFS
jgi:hypothetical protein